MSSTSPDNNASRPLNMSADSIRLLTIELELSEKGYLVCSLQVVTFSQPQKYEALSYRWGDESVQKTILVDGVEMSVTENLHAALQYMHAKQRGLPIWIDAISINQNDVPEKSRQLRIMPHIYSRAANVLVWLGTKYTTVDLVIEEDIQKSDSGRECRRLLETSLDFVGNWKSTQDSSLHWCRRGFGLGSPRAYSQYLSCPSKVFKTMFGPSWSEGQNLST